MSRTSPHFPRSLELHLLRGGGPRQEPAPLPVLSSVTWHSSRRPQTNLPFLVNLIFSGLNLFVDPDESRLSESLKRSLFPVSVFLAVTFRGGSVLQTRKLGPREMKHDSHSWSGCGRSQGPACGLFLLLPCPVRSDTHLPVSHDLCVSPS